MKIKSFISIVLGLSISASSLPVLAEDEYISCDEIFLSPSLTEQIPYELVIDGEGAVAIDDIVNDIPTTFGLSRLPAYYNSAKEGLVTPAKNQNPYGTCWSFATTSAMETSMIKNGYKALEDVDYSELHLAYFAHTRNSFTGDGENVTSENYGYYGGGNTVIAAQYLAGWQGMVDESDFPYPPADKNYTIPESARYLSKAHLQDFYVLNSGAVKQAIMDYGSVVVSFYDDNQYFSGNAYYRGIQGSSTNHAVTIVGWDDNYALSNFSSLSKKPKNPGAWIVKNSWGKNWGDNGYFYLSYEEPSMANFVAFNAESANNYDVIHQYDGATNKLTLDATKYANIFTAKDDQDLEAIGLYTSFPCTDYTIKIYRLNKNYTSPEDGVLLDTLTGTEEFVGFHTLELPTPDPLSPGDKFSVVCSLKGLYNMSYVPYAPFEGNTAYSDLNNSSGRGESFAYSTEWIDTYGLSTSTMKINNAAIKAYSCYDYVTVNYNDADATISSIDMLISSLLDIPENPEKDGFYFAGWYKDKNLTTPWDFETDKIRGETTLYAKWSDSPIPVESITLNSTSGGILTDDTIEVKASIKPYYATDNGILWSSSNPSVATVESGVITGIKKGSAIISASSESGMSAEYTLNVYNPMTNVQLGLQKPVFSTTDNVLISIICPEAKYFVIHFTDSKSNHYYTRNIENTTDGSVKNVSLSPLSADNYTMWVEAWDYLGNKLESPTKSMRVTNDLVLVAAKNQDGYIAGGYNNNAQGELICAYYDSDDNFIGAIKKKNSEYPTVTFPKLSGTKWVKVMWWDSTSGMTPITNSIIISD